jgi:chromosome segregation ATPase
LNSDVRQVENLAQTLVKNVAEVLNEQAGLHRTVQNNNEALAGDIQTIHQSHKNLQTQVEEAAGTGKQTLAAVTGIAAEQTVVRERAEHIVAGVTGIEAQQASFGQALQAQAEAASTGMAGLATGHEQLNSDVRQVENLAQSLVKNVAEVLNEQAGLHRTVQNNNEALAASTEAIQQGQKTVQAEVDRMAALAEHHQTHLDTLNTIAQQAATNLGAISGRQADLEQPARAACDDLIARLAALAQDQQQWIQQFNLTQADIREIVASMSRLEQEIVGLPKSVQTSIQSVTDLLAAASQHHVQVGDKLDQNLRELIDSISHIQEARSAHEPTCKRQKTAARRQPVSVKRQ